MIDTVNRAAQDHLLRVIVEEHLRDELAIRDWWATTGKRMGWTDNDPAGLRADHRTRLRLLVSMLKAARKAR